MPRTVHATTVRSTAALLIAGWVSSRHAAATSYQFIRDLRGGLGVGAATDGGYLVVVSALRLVIATSTDKTRGNGRETEFYMLMLAASLTPMLGGATDLLVLQAGLQLSSIPLSGLIG